MIDLISSLIGVDPGFLDGELGFIVCAAIALILVFVVFRLFYDWIRRLFGS